MVDLPGYIWMKIAGMRVTIEDYYNKDYGVGDTVAEKQHKLDFFAELATTEPDSIEDYGVTFDMEVLGNPGTKFDMVKDGGMRVVTSANHSEWVSRLTSA
eukprot:SAG31_NODE_17648_length_663_cov_0.820922_1_plen_99_part_10